MKRAEIIIFDRLKCTKTGTRFYYFIDNKEYSFYCSFDHSKVHLDEESKYVALAHIGLSYLIDLAVICTPKKILIKTMKLSNEQLKFWKWAYENFALEKAYMGQEELFFLDTKWETKGRKFQNLPRKTAKKDTLAIAISGGKESLTALKLFKNHKNLSLFFMDYCDRNSFYMKKAHQFLEKKYKYFKIKTSISHTDQITKKYECVDYSLLVIGQLIFTAVLFGDKIDYFMVGNEYSANFGNAFYKGKYVNHQFDKTIEFANEVNRYISKYLGGVIGYISPFFGLYEYQITKLFLKDRDFLDIWTSCNNSNRIYNFCCKCHKCAFIYMVASAFADKDLLAKYFPTNPLEDFDLCRPLVDPRMEKPTECVGEKKECWLALKKSLDQGKHKSLPLAQYFENEILPKIKNDILKMELEITAEHTNYKYLPEIFARMIKSQL